MLCNISQNAMGQTLGGGGYPYPIMLCNISQNAMGQTPRGVPCQVQPGGRGTLPGGTLQGGYPAGGYLAGGGYPAGGTQLGQQKEYSLHGGWYASCVHAGGLSCFNNMIWPGFRHFWYNSVPYKFLVQTWHRARHDIRLLLLSHFKIS